jgi:hypothetical protein
MHVPCPAICERIPPIQPAQIKAFWGAFHAKVKAGSQNCCGSRETGGNQRRGALEKILARANAATEVSAGKSLSPPILLSKHVWGILRIAAEFCCFINQKISRGAPLRGRGTPAIPARLRSERARELFTEIVVTRNQRLMLVFAVAHELVPFDCCYHPYRTLFAVLRTLYAA